MSKPILTEQDIQTLSAMALHGGNVRLAARHLGKADQTVKNRLYRIYLRLGVSGLVEAFREMGWLVVRDADPSCPDWCTSARIHVEDA